MVMIEASGAMHLVKELPAEDARKLRMMANTVQLLDSNGRLDRKATLTMFEDAYRIGRETEAQRHRAFMVGSMRDAEKICIIRALEYCGNNAVKAAAMLEIGKSTMYRKMREFQIDYGNHTNGAEAQS